MASKAAKEILTLTTDTVVEALLCAEECCNKQAAVKCTIMSAGVTQHYSKLAGTTAFEVTLKE